MSDEGVCFHRRLAPLKGFLSSKHNLAIVSRCVLKDCDVIFEQVLHKIGGFEVEGEVRSLYARSDILRLLQLAKMPKSLEPLASFDLWLSDMVEVCKCYCKIIGQASLCFWLGSKRGCSFLSRRCCSVTNACNLRWSWNGMGPSQFN